VDEAVPYAEFKANPYTVIASTSLGGHLCWFEVGGGRWFSRPVRDFSLLFLFSFFWFYLSMLIIPSRFATS